MIQDIFPHRLLNSYVPDKNHTDDSLAVVFEDGKMKLNNGNSTIIYTKK